MSSDQAAARARDGLGPVRPDELVDLRAPGAGNDPASYLRRLWELRFYLLAQSTGQVQSTYVQTTLGRLWLLLSPLLDVIFFFVVFGLGFRADRAIADGVDFLTYLLVGMTSHNLIIRFVNQSIGSLTASSAIAVDFPRATLPIGRYLKALYEYPYALFVCFVLIWVRGSGPRLSWLAFVPLTLLGIAVGCGAGFVLARVSSRFPDLGRVITRITRFSFWGAGVVMPVEVFLLNSRWGADALNAYTVINPIFGVVKLHQWAAFGYDAGALRLALVSALVWGVLLFIFGFIFLVRGEATYQEAQLRRDR